MTIIGHERDWFRFHHPGGVSGAVTDFDGLAWSWFRILIRHLLSG